MFSKILTRHIRSKHKCFRISAFICCFIFVMNAFRRYNNQLRSINIISSPTIVEESSFVMGHLENFPKHHTELETHRIQMNLSASAGIEELHKLMAKQYDVKHGLYKDKPYKKILYWNSALTLPLRKKNANFGVGVGRDQYQKAGCPVWQCETSHNRSNLMEYDAIIFNTLGLNGTTIPANRSPHQRYIFFSFESPLVRYIWHGSDLNFPPGFFNWTMTYRWDSDVIHPYGWVEPVNVNSVPMHPSPEVYRRSMESFRTTLQHINYAEGKTKMIVSFMSNCRSKSKREKVMEMLSNIIPVDNYGRCGNNMTCGTPFDYARPKQVEEDCLANMTKHYKFFLAFHNALCQDYIAERFFNALRYPVVPIVIDAHGHHAKMAPPHSFINILDFPSIPALANYLMLLDKNDTLYNEYFWWKSQYRVRNGQFYEGMHLKNYCSLCAALHNPALHSNEKQNNEHRTMQDWWESKGNCKTLAFDGLFTQPIGKKGI